MAPTKKRTNTKQRKKDPKLKAKLEAFLEDFDSEVKTRLGQLQELKSQMLKDVENSYNLALIKIPSSVKKMNWMACFGLDKGPQVNDGKSQNEEDAPVIENADDHAVVMKAVKMSKKKSTAKSTSNDETVPRTLRKGRTAKKPPTTSKRARGNSTIRRSSRTAMVTPARALLNASIIGQTPLITPRFDPRLPKTPAVRGPRHKERVFSISANGSPISAADGEVVLNVPVGNGESIQLLASQLDSVDLSLLDQTALKSIRQLQRCLTSFGGPST
ncbi:borealin [Corythoichthys intestinalis]|uniref:borealin n=1 Tax=Corythoichthys intestinalis TaxID=161448 RepID=UPI0025A67A13|nr:borealin [Corythoichthys intestinalis]